MPYLIEIQLTAVSRSQMETVPESVAETIVWGCVGGTATHETGDPCVPTTTTWDYPYVSNCFGDSWQKNGQFWLSGNDIFERIGCDIVVQYYVWVVRQSRKRSVPTSVFQAHSRTFPLLCAQRIYRYIVTLQLARVHYKYSNSTGFVRAPFRYFQSTASGLLEGMGW